MEIIDSIDSKKAIDEMNNGKIVVFGGGTGKPGFSTDTGAALRAKDIKADMIVKLTNVDGVYDKDPNKYLNAKKFDKITFDEVICEELQVMDLSAMEICRDNNINIVVMNIDDEQGLYNLIKGDKVGTLVYKGD